MVSDGGRSGSRARAGSRGQAARKKPAAKVAGRPDSPPDAPPNGKGGLAPTARATPRAARAKKATDTKPVVATKVAATTTAGGSGPDPNDPIGVPASKRALRSQGRETMQKL